MAVAEVRLAYEHRETGEVHLVVLDLLVAL
jgi:hypothetical protein